MNDIRTEAQRRGRGLRSNPNGLEGIEIHPAVDTMLRESIDKGRSWARTVLGYQRAGQLDTLQAAKNRVLHELEQAVAEGRDDVQELRDILPALDW